MFPKPTVKKDRELLNSYHTRRCVACNRRGAEPHHLKTVKSGGPDEVWNIMPLDRQHHAEVHTIGLTKFAKKYPSVEKFLLSFGWEFDEKLQRWNRMGLTES